ncbi:MAG: 30S ribosomal protein S6 [Proteobacteria bacterium]|nr:30S ribosomal protein S6 [Pseudomonadota bacterium]
MAMKRNNYEVIVVVDANLTDEECQGVIDKHKEVVVNAGGNISFESRWGRRRLAYDIRKMKFGIYHLLYIEGDGNVVEEMERQFGYDDTVLKYFVVMVEDLETAYNKFESLKADPRKTANLISDRIGA